MGEKAIPCPLERSQGQPYPTLCEGLGPWQFFVPRAPDDQVLLCRQGPRTSRSADEAQLPTAHAPELTFREVTGEDTNLQAFVDAQSDLLEACPVDSLLSPL